MSKFATKKWIKVSYLSSGQYSVNKNIRFKTSKVRSYLCDYSDPHIVSKGTMDLPAAADNKNDKAEKDVVSKNIAPLTSFISKINNTSIENGEDLSIVMPMCNLLEYSQSYSLTSESLWNYRDKINDIGDNTPDGKNHLFIR